MFLPIWGHKERAKGNAQLRRSNLAGTIDNLFPHTWKPQTEDVVTQTGGQRQPRCRCETHPVVYGELHRVAQRHLRLERPDHTLQPTALVYEAFLKLVAQRDDAAAQSWPEKAYKNREEVILHIKSDHRWDPYRSDLRFQEIYRRVGLPQ